VSIVGAQRRGAERAPRWALARRAIRIGAIGAGRRCATVSTIRSVRRRERSNHRATARSAAGAWSCRWRRPGGRPAAPNTANSPRAPL